MEDFYNAVDTIIAVAEEVRIKYDHKFSYDYIKEMQKKTLEKAKEINFPDIAAKASDENPSKKEEIKRRVIAVMFEGKRLEDSYLG